MASWSSISDYLHVYSILYIFVFMWFWMLNPSSQDTSFRTLNSEKSLVLGHWCWVTSQFVVHTSVKQKGICGTPVSCTRYQQGSCSTSSTNRSNAKGWYISDICVPIQFFYRINLTLHLERKKEDGYRVSVLLQSSATVLVLQHYMKLLRNSQLNFLRD